MPCVERKLITAFIMFVLALIYGIAGSFVPAVPYQSDRTLIYPLLLFYKEMLLRIGITVLVAVVIIWISSRLSALPSRDRAWTITLLIMTLAIVLFTNRNLFAPEYRHHDTVAIGEHIYHLGSSSGPDWPALQYLVYRCDQQGLVCQLAAIAVSDIDRSQLPSGTSADRSASFMIDDTGSLFVALHGDYYRVLLNDPA